MANCQVIISHSQALTVKYYSSVSLVIVVVKESFVRGRLILAEVLVKCGLTLNSSPREPHQKGRSERKPTKEKVPATSLENLMLLLTAVLVRFLLRGRPGT